jgi:hypothetical protein
MDQRSGSFSNCLRRLGQLLPLAIALEEIDNLDWPTAEATSLAFSTGPVWSSADIERFVA